MNKICSVCHVQKLTTEFHKNNTKKDGLQTKCKSCSSALTKIYYRANTTLIKKTIRQNSQNRREIIRKNLWNYLLNHPCVDCGENDPIVLEFDHIDPSQKTYSIGNMCRDMGWGKIELEISKCLVRCANCHRRKTAKDFSYWRHDYECSP